MERYILNGRQSFGVNDIPNGSVVVVMGIGLRAIHHIRDGVKKVKGNNESILINPEAPVKEIANPNFSQFSIGGRSFTVDIESDAKLLKAKTGSTVAQVHLTATEHEVDELNEDGQPTGVKISRKSFRYDFLVEVKDLVAEKQAEKDDAKHAAEMAAIAATQVAPADELAALKAEFEAMKAAKAPAAAPAAGAAAYAG